MPEELPHETSAERDIKVDQREELPLVTSCKHEGLPIITSAERNLKVDDQCEKLPHITSHKPEELPCVTSAERDLKVHQCEVCLQPSEQKLSYGWCHLQINCDLSI